MQTSRHRLRSAPRSPARCSVASPRRSREQLGAQGDGGLPRHRPLVRRQREGAADRARSRPLHAGARQLARAARSAAANAGDRRRLAEGAHQARVRIRRRSAARSRPTRRTRVVIDLRPDDVTLARGRRRRGARRRSRAASRFASSRRGAARCRCARRSTSSTRPASPARSRRAFDPDIVEVTGPRHLVAQVDVGANDHDDDPLPRFAAASRRHRYDGLRHGVRVKPAQVKVSSYDARPRRTPLMRDPRHRDIVRRDVGGRARRNAATTSTLELARDPVAGRASDLRRRRAGDRVARAPDGDRAGRRTRARRRRRRATSTPSR